MSKPSTGSADRYRPHIPQAWRQRVLCRCCNDSTFRPDERLSARGTICGFCRNPGCYVLTLIYGADLVSQAHTASTVAGAS